MEVKFSTRNVRLSDRFQDYTSEKAQKAILQNGKDYDLEIKITRQKDRRSQGSSADKVELTLSHAKGGVIRAEAEASDKYSAFDVALGRMLERVRRARDRSKISRTGKHRPTSLQEASMAAFSQLDIVPADARLLNGDTGAIDTITEEHDQYEDSPVIIRKKVFPSTRITIDDALYQMELVGHDFYLFVDAETDRPSVVYRRKGWDFGVIGLDIEDETPAKS